MLGLGDFAQKVKNWFDWTPVDVYGPVAIHQDYLDKGRVLLGYKVEVVYKHHGSKEYLFVHDEDKLGIVSKAQARDNAIKFARAKRKLILQK